MPVINISTQMKAWMYKQTNANGSQQKVWRSLTAYQLIQWEYQVTCAVWHRITLYSSWFGMSKALLTLIIRAVIIDFYLLCIWILNVWLGSGAYALSGKLSPCRWTNRFTTILSKCLTHFYYWSVTDVP